MDDLKHKLEIRAWTMYDWANSAFATTVMGAILPTYFSAYIAAGRSLSLWGYTVAIGSLLAALISPILGAIADFRASKKKFMAIFVALGVISTGLHPKNGCFVVSFISWAQSDLLARWCFTIRFSRM